MTACNLYPQFGDGCAQSLNLGLQRGDALLLRHSVLTMYTG